MKQSGRKDKPSRSLTAYNHFLHQEKQFVLALNLADPQSGTGQHGGGRWTTMSEMEKRLYTVQRESELQEFI